MLSPADYLGGLALLAATSGSVAVAAWLIVARRLAGERGAARTLAVGLIAMTGIIAVHLLPGLVGLLSRWSALACALLVLGGAAALPSRRAVPPTPRRRPVPSGGPVSYVLAAVALAAVAAWTLASAFAVAAAPSTEIDTLTFHLPVVARWMETGSLWGVHQFTPLLANGNYPQNGDLMFLAAVLPFDSDAFARFVPVPFAALAGVSVYAIATELRAPRATAVLAACVFVSIPALVFATHEGAKTDAVMLAALGAGLLFLLRHFRDGRRAHLLLAGLGLGIAFGTKWYGVSSVVVVLGVWAVSALLARRPVRGVARDLGLLGGLVALAGGFWLLRNVVESGSPVFPSGLGAGGLTLFDAPRDFIRECGGFTIAGYADQPGIWPDFILPAWQANYGLTGPLLVAVLLIAALIVLRDRRLRRPGSAALLALSAAGAGLFLAYSVTPYSAFGPLDMPVLVGANTRWLLPALLVGCMLLAAVCARAGRARVVLEALAFAAVADGVRRGFAIERGLVLKVLIVLAVVAVAGYALRRHGHRLGGRRRAVEVVLAGTAVAAVVAVGHDRQQRFFEARYTTGDPVITHFARTASEGGRRVALAGIWTVDGLAPVLPAYGPRFTNRVEFAGPFVDGLLREYPDRAGFLAALRDGGYDLLVVGKGDYGYCRVPGREGDELAWARAAGFTPLAESDRLALFRLPRAGR